MPCDNCFYNSPKVGTRGPIDSPFVIIGESPGITEVAKGLPFVGPSGTVIEDTLIKMGAQRMYDMGIQPFFTNAIHCLPLRKDPQNVAAACLRCRPRMLSELEKHPRKVILSLGGPALQSLLGNFDLKITRERGKLFKSELAEIGIVAAVHPAFLLRGQGNYTQFERDVKYAIDLMCDGESARKLPSGTSYEVLDSLREVKQFIGDVLYKLPEGSPIGSDIETTGFNYQTDSILCVGLQYAPHKSAIINNWDYETRKTKGLLSHLLWRPELNYVWHNGKFDCRFLRYENFDSHPRVDDDTLLLNYALNERRGIHDLDQVASDWLGSVNHKGLVDHIYKTKVIDPITGKERKGNLSDIDRELLWKYLALDVNDTYHLLPTLKDQVYANPDLKKFYLDHLKPGSEYLLKLEMNGLLVSEEWVHKNYQRLKTECEDLEDKINLIAIEHMGVKINPRSPKQLKELLYGTLKLGSKSLSTDDDTLEILPKHPVIPLLQSYRGASKSLGTYVIPLIQHNRENFPGLNGKVSKNATVVYPDGRTHSSYLLHGTPTSRLACRDLNVQNIQRDPQIRGQFCAPEGMVILEFDYSQAELRSLAALSLCEALLEIFRSGKDLHNEFSAYLFGEGFTREEKMAAKTVNFGIPYGREAPSIASDPQLNAKMDVTVQLAQSWIDGWAQRFPGAWAFIQKCRAAPALGQTITTCFGNKKRPGVVSREKLRDLQNESANFPHQSIASNLTVRSGIELFDPLRDEYDAHIVNTVHDCLVLYAPRNLETIRAIAKFVQNKMEEIPQRFPSLRIVPFKTSGEVGYHWGNLMDLSKINTQEELNNIPHYIPAH